MKKLLLFLLYLLVHQFSYAQDSLHYRITVLEKEYIDSTFVFDDSKNEFKDIQYITYLGTLYDSINNTKYKVLKSLWIWNISSRATGRILIYDLTNKYLGDYCTTILPCCIKNNNLIFEIRDSSKKLMYTIGFSFKKGIPKKLLLQTENNSYEHIPFSGE